MRVIVSNTLLSNKDNGARAWRKLFRRLAKEFPGGFHFRKVAERLL